MVMRLILNVQKNQLEQEQEEEEDEEDLKLELIYQVPKIKYLKKLSKLYNINIYYKFLNSAIK